MYNFRDSALVCEEKLLNQPALVKTLSTMRLWNLQFRDFVMSLTKEVYVCRSSATMQRCAGAPLQPRGTPSDTSIFPTPEIPNFVKKYSTAIPQSRICQNYFLECQQPAISERAVRIVAAADSISAFNVSNAGEACCGVSGSNWH